MASAVSRQEDQLLAVECPEHKRIGWCTERRFDTPPSDVFESVYLIDARATDHTDHGWRSRIRHFASLCHYFNH